MLTVWFFLLLLESILTLLLWMTRADRSYPAFTCYVTFQVGEAFALQACYYLHLGAAGFYVYWISFAVDVVLKLAVLIELFHRGLQTELIERQVVRRFYWTVGVVALVSLLLSRHFPSAYPNRAMAVARTADTWASLGLCLVFVAIVMGAFWQGVWWLNRPRGIALGLMLYLPFRLIARLAVHSAGRRTVYWLNWIELVSYLGTLLIWIRAFVVPEVHLIEVSAEELPKRVRELQTSGKVLK